MTRPSWLLRHIRAVLYVGLALSAVGVAVVCAVDDPETPWIGGRQLFGLWALSLLITSMLIGPLTSVLRPFPFRAYLVLGRRAIGVSAFFFATLHALSYTGTLLAQGGVDLFIKEVLAEGWLWITGLVIGALLLSTLAVLAATSFDRMVTKVGPKRWKVLHQAVYVILPLALLHAILLGADFGFHRAHDVLVEPDIGALIGMSSLTALWIVLFVMRRRGVIKDITPWLDRLWKRSRA
ncbi:MAG: ferric reductase-like transmembrane domain-containing protein [Vicinamibacteria bacterium]